MIEYPIPRYQAWEAESVSLAAEDLFNFVCSYFFAGVCLLVRPAVAALVKNS